MPLRTYDSLRAPTAVLDNKNARKHRTKNISIYFVLR